MIYLEDVKAEIDRFGSSDPLFLAPCTDSPARALCRGDPHAHCRRYRDHHLQQRQHRRSQGRGPLAFQHRFQYRGDRQVYRVLETDRLMGILPFFHSFGYTMFWFAANSGMGIDLPSQPARRGRDRLARRAISRYGAAGHADFSSALHAPLHARPVRLDPAGPASVPRSCPSRWH